jgi:hypothetical protein
MRLSFFYKMVMKVIYNLHFQMKAFNFTLIIILFHPHCHVRYTLQSSFVAHGIISSCVNTVRSESVLCFVQQRDDVTCVLLQIANSGFVKRIDLTLTSVQLQRTTNCSGCV